MLKPYFSNHFKCHDCQKEFLLATTYSPDPTLKETYCSNCVEMIEEELRPKKIKSFAPPTEATDLPPETLLLSDKRTLRKTGRIHQFNTSVTKEWLTKLKQIAYEERLNYNQVLERALECYIKYLKRTKN